MKYLINFLRNIKWLMLHPLREREWDIIYNALERIEDVYRYQIMDTNSGRSKKSLTILDAEATVDTLLKNNKSFARFGDGEINLMMGRSIPFQDYHEELANKLYEVMTSNREDLYIGLNYGYFHISNSQPEFVRKFRLTVGKQFADFCIEHGNEARIYLDAAFNLVYMGTIDGNYEQYYQRVKELFRAKDVVVFAGEGTLKNIKYDILELAAKKDYIYGPGKNSYKAYDDLLEKAKACSKDQLLLFAIGPTSKVLVYELTCRGYLAWDIGHLFKDYDSYRKKVKKDEADIKTFYAPDV